MNCYVLKLNVCNTVPFPTTVELEEQIWNQYNFTRLQLAGLEVTLQITI